MFIEPVFGKKFVGREEILAVLHKRAAAIKGGYRQNLALAGPMLSGKSSILRHFLSNISDPEIIPVYVELGEDDFANFAARFMATMMHRFLEVEGVRAGADFDGMRRECAKRIPLTVAEIDRITEFLRKKKNDLAYEKMLDLASVLRREAGKCCIIIFDEFHNLSRFSLKRPFLVFGKFIMVQKNTMYIVTSSQKTLLKDILSKKLSLLFGNFEMIDVAGFDDATARSFIKDKLENVFMPPEMVGYLAHLTQGNPFYLETIAKKYVYFARAVLAEKGEKECLLEAMAELLFKSSGVLNQYFTNNVNFFLERSARRSFVPVLISLAKGNRKTRDILAGMRRSDGDIVKKLRKLCEMDLVEKKGVFYVLQDRLFEFWLRNVFGMKRDAIVDDMDMRYFEFKEKASSEYGDYGRFASREIPELVRELFSSFNNEKVSIGRQDRILARFGSVVMKKLSGNVSQAEALGAGGSWLVRVKQNDVMNENDIHELCSPKVSSSGAKIVRRLAVHLGGIEHNAFLLAKENNVWVWGMKELNEIMTLFGKFTFTS